MGKKKPRSRLSFTPDFKAEIVEPCRRGDRSVGQIAKDFDLTETAVRDRGKHAEVDKGERGCLTSNDHEELAALRRENRRLREDVEVLKRATAFFRDGIAVTVHPFIEAEKRAGHSVERACELLKVSRTAFYARRTGKPGPRSVRDAELTKRITQVHQHSPGTYGAPRVHGILRREGEECGRRRVARLTWEAGLQARHRRRRHLTTIAGPGEASRLDLIVWNFHPDSTGLDARGCGEITCIPTGEGWLHLATMIDISSRQVIGWATADQMSEIR
ncbi:IS3 family transposase [Streptomyces virginiae]|uniref:IS3 family transposase n=1 Tax=Streptomyces virginiae TaxID=1961 RepID=UPI0037200E34